MPKALSNIRVLDLGQYEAATTTGMLMAFLGAEVIKVEPPAKGDPARYATPGAPKDADSMYFIYMNLNKKSITLDLNRTKGVEICKEMVKQVDVVIDNFPNGTMEKMGLGYDVLKEINPRLIMGSITPYGSWGPYAGYPGNDMVAEAISGASMITGVAKDPPVRPGPSVGEAGSAVMMFGAIMAALHQRERTGKGQKVEVAMADTVLANMRVKMANTQMEADQMFQKNPLKRTTPTYAEVPLLTKNYATDDNMIVMITMTNAHQERLFKTIGREDMLSAPKMQTPYMIYMDREWAKVYFGAVAEWVKTQGGYEAFHKLAQAKVPVGVTLNTTQLMSDPHFIARKTVVEIEHPVRGKMKVPTTPLRLGKSPFEVKSSPLLGENNNEVYASLLGYTKDDLAKLKKTGIV